MAKQIAVVSLLLPSSHNSSFLKIDLGLHWPRTDFFKVFLKFLYFQPNFGNVKLGGCNRAFQSSVFIHVQVDRCDSPLSPMFIGTDSRMCHCRSLGVGICNRHTQLTSARHEHFCGTTVGGRAGHFLTPTLQIEKWVSTLLCVPSFSLSRTGRCKCVSGMDTAPSQAWWWRGESATCSRICDTAWPG